MAFGMLENRCSRIQATGPMVVLGAGSFSTYSVRTKAIDRSVMTRLPAQRSTNAIRALYQFMNSEVTRLRPR